MAERGKSGPAAQNYSLPPSSRTLPVLRSHDCVVALRALGEDTRVRIIGLLIDAPLEVGEISKQLEVSPYNVSKHLRILREAGLLEVQKEGRCHRYALPDAIRRRAAEGSVLDLGCCTFQFQGEMAGEARVAAKSQRRRAASRRGPRGAKVRAAE